MRHVLISEVLEYEIGEHYSRASAKCPDIIESSSPHV